MKKKKRINSQKKVASIDDIFFDLKKIVNDDKVYDDVTILKKKDNKNKTPNKNNSNNKKVSNSYNEPALEKKEVKNKSQNKNNANKNNKKNSHSYNEPTLRKKDSSLYSNEISKNKKDRNKRQNTTVKNNKDQKQNNNVKENKDINQKSASSKKSYFKLKRTIILFLFILLIGIVIYLVYSYQVDKIKEEQRLKDEQLVSNIISHYDENVIVNDDAIIYTYDENNNKYLETGMIYQGVQLSLEEIEITKDIKYFYIPNLDCYIEYQSVLPVENLQEKDNRYKKYIPFNKNVVTDENFTLYKDENKIYTFNKSMSFPIIINDYDNKYYIEFNNELLYLLKDDVKDIVDNTNTSLKNTSHISVLNYHFINDSNTKCNKFICLSSKKFEEHLKYIKSENIFTPTMQEFELYLDKKIQLPKSALLTFDDGWLRQTAIKILDEYEINATFFLVTSWYLPLESKYVEFHSHTHNMHNRGDCPTGQGGGIQCLSEKKIQADLEKSRSILNNTTVFCYPFYEYNNYSISQLKKAGFTMAFIGGNRKAYPGVNKYKIPRYVIYNTTTVDKLKKMI